MHSLIMELEYIQQVAEHDVPLPSQSQGNTQVFGVHLVVVALRGKVYGRRGEEESDREWGFRRQTNLCV